MLIAHLPAGYLSARLLSRRFAHRWLLPACLFGSVLPDVDLLWFYLVDDGAKHHHRYWTHIPLVWLALAALYLTGCALLHKLGRTPDERRKARAAALVGGALLGNVLLHHVLDTVVGHIMWGFPLTTRLYALAEVPPAYPHWILSFVLHWSFLLELALLAVAVGVARLRPRRA